MPLNARRHLRKMRGGAQAHLLEAGDGHFYVVKFRNNPQHRRILTNELIASKLLGHLGLSAPETAIVTVTREFLDANPDVAFQFGGKAAPVEPGRHFGSRFPGNPETLAVYDFLPDALLPSVRNIQDILGALVFDKWVANSDSRQAVFHRTREDGMAHFVCRLIDHGFAFNGPHWDYPDSPVQGLYHRKLVYASVRSLDDFQPWLDRTLHFPESVIDEAYRGVPREWLEAEDEAALEQLLERLLRRRKRVPDLLSDCREARTNPFPFW